MKKERMGRLVGKTINPNVDLIEANSLFKKAVDELRINVKTSKRNIRD